MNSPFSFKQGFWFNLATNLNVANKENIQFDLANVRKSKQTFETLYVKTQTHYVPCSCSSADILPKNYHCQVTYQLCVNIT